MFINLGFQRQWMENYTLPGENGARSATKALKILTGTETVSFAYPCGQTFIGRE